MRLLIGAMFLAVACTSAPAASPTIPPDDLPDAVSILSVEYHEAYRLLPLDDAHSRERIDGEFANFDLAAWQALEWDPEGYETVPQPLNVAGVLPMLQSAAGRSEDRQWVADRIRPLDHDAADKFLAAKNVFELTDILEELVDEHGYYREVEEISLRFGGMKAGHSQEFIELDVQKYFARMDYHDAHAELGFKEQTVRENEISICVLLMELVVGADPFTTIVDGRCDIDRALDMAKTPTSRSAKSHGRVITGSGRVA